MSVAYCAMVFPAPRILDPLAPILAVGSRIVSYDHVLEEVRFKGTPTVEDAPMVRVWACGILLLPRSVDLEDTGRVPGGGEIRARQRLVAGRRGPGHHRTAKEFERPNRPAESTGTALWRHLSGDTFARRQAGTRRCWRRLRQSEEGVVVGF